SGAGLYGDVIQEIDWSVGQIMAALKQHGLDERTLVIFSSDNGPWLSYGNHAGSAGSLREGKGTTWQGGQQVPCVVRWPGKIEAGSECRELSTTMDILPTLANLAGGKAPEDRKIDGRDIWMLLSGQMVRASPEPSLNYYWDYGLDAVRMGPWKLVFPHKFRSLTGPAGKDGQPGGYSEATTELALFNLDADVGEMRNIAADHPQIVADLQRLAEQAREDLGDSHQKRPGKNRRPPGRLAP
ncbi:MAG: sulfatase-like hydrolase/transferase, partial [Pirellulaceae bacterium]